MNIAYVRVSTGDQNEARQIEALEKYGIERWYMIDPDKDQPE